MNKPDDRLTSAVAPTLSTLIGCFCHDLNNALTGALTCVQASRFETPELAASFNDIETCLVQSIQLSRQLSSIPWQQRPIEAVELAPILNHTQRQLTQLYKLSLTYDLEAVQQLAKIPGHTAVLQCLLLNLCQYLNGGKLEVATSPTSITLQFTGSIVETPPQRFAWMIAQTLATSLGYSLNSLTPQSLELIIPQKVEPR